MQFHLEDTLFTTLTKNRIFKSGGVGGESDNDCGGLRICKKKIPNSKTNSEYDGATVVSRLEAKGFVFPSNIKFPDVTPPLYSDNDSVALGDWSDRDPFFDRI
ncbi:hypothetical protein L1887_37693 [Cichorium endivia]|nr:hypothetical protein L1887_37693 [Cichorium endivia]